MIAFLVAVMLAALGIQAATTDDPPHICRPKALGAEGGKRQQALLATVKASVKETHELSDGYALRLPADPKLFRELAEWVSLEHQCCGFVDYALEWKRDDSVWVKLTGAPGTKQALAAEMGLAASRP